METAITPSQPPAAEQLITVKVLYDDSNRRFKLPLKDLRAQVFPQKLRLLLGVPADVNVILERYSDSAGSYIRLDSDNVAVYKQLYRAAKAKSKLRVKATTVDLPAAASPVVPQPADQPPMTQPATTRPSYLDTVLSSPVPVARPETLPLITSDPAPNGVGDVQETQQAPPTSGQPQHREFEMEHDRLHFPVISHSSPNGMFCIDCNNCGRSIASEHFHCSICENGDYDLCPTCVDAGASCRGDGHWLIKRVVSNGNVTNSTTETLPLRESAVQDTDSKRKAPAKPMPKRLFKSTRAGAADKGEENAMCNGCCLEHDARNMVRCNECEDFDLCLRCLLRNKHGHNPAHSFQLGYDRDYCLKNLILARCAPGRQFKHAAVCDGCETRIVGIRHKCLSCPDWDYCQDCIKTASQTHPDHRFVPIYDAIAEPPRLQEIHYGIFCDGPLCQNKPAQSYITGARYKCAVCDDTDFCANCEALPNTRHNRTHPLIKFKTPVRKVTVSTLGDDGASGTITLGDQSRVFANPSAATLVGGTEEKQLAEEMPPVEVEASKPTAKTGLVPLSTDAVSTADFQGFFIRDTVTDGTKLPPNTTFQQTWTLYNPGPRAWPIDSDVRFVGGDTMFDVDANHPSSLETIRSAMESNKLAAPVEPGQSADFTVTLRTPSREGTAISYWRLKLPNGMPIGHRLWCDIQVQAASAPADWEPALVEKAEAPASEVPASSDAPVTASPDGSSSGMIFPKLDKESPETSTHEAEAAAVTPEPAPQAPTLTNSSEGDVLEDVESLTLDEADTETGFLTDEEYDVLDASDQEYQEAKQSVN